VLFNLYAKELDLKPLTEFGWKTLCKCWGLW